MGRWGNFFNSEAFGRPTQSFLKLYIPIYKRPLEYLQYNYFHPTFLYESILDVCIFLILFFIIRKIVQKNQYVTLNSIQGRIVERSCDAVKNQTFCMKAGFGKSSQTNSARHDSGDGIVFFSYLILYSIARIFVEQIRIDSVFDVWGIPIAQIISCLVIVVSIFAIVKILNE